VIFHLPIGKLNMNLKDFLNSRDKPPELYWSLVIEHGWVQAGIWYIADKAEVISVSPPAAWETEEELVGACDAALSSCVAKLPENYNEPSKTVFGVVANWVKDGEIIDEHLAKIKKVCTDLSLTPVGFVVLPEAIANLYKAEEGTPLSAVIVGLGTENLEVSVFKLGNLVGTTTVARSISLIGDVTEGLSRFEGASPLPSRIVVYDGKGGELEEAKEELMKNSWDGEGKVKFLHTPKAEILVSDRKVLATSLAGANEIGDVSEITTPIEPEKEVEILPPKEEIENITEPQNSTTPEALGFMVDEDVANNYQPVASPIQTPPPAIAQPTHFPETVSHPVTPNRFGVGVKSLFHGFSSKIKIQGGNTPNMLRPLSFLVVIFGILVAAGLSWWFLPKATVTIFVSPKTFQEQVNLSFNTDGKFDESQAIIPGVLITSSATGEKTKSTTGTKLVGDKAKGSVQIANGNGNSINLSSGTILTSSAGLKYITNTDASISGQLIPGSPGTAILAVTAADVGAAYNLAKGEVFKVGLFDKSQVAGTSQTDFSGGSSQQIAAVSADDQKKLEADLKKELSAKVLSDLTNKVNSDQVFVNNLSAIDISSETFDHKVGDVADTLKISLNVKGTAIAADKAKLFQYATDSIKSKIPNGYVLKSSQIDFKFSFVGNQNGNASYNVDIGANFLPLIDVNDITHKISGKTQSVVESYLSSVSGFSRAEIKISPVLPGPFKTLPHVPKNIKIEVVSDE
jgi:hypothetical protein